MLFDQQAFYLLLTICGINHDGTLESIVAATQKHWLIPRNKPVPLEGTTYPIAHSARIRELLSQLGYIEAIKPLKIHYDYVVFLGGEIPTMEPRIDYLLKLCKEELRFNKLIFHCGLQNIPLEDGEWASAYTELSEVNAARTLLKRARAEETCKVPITFVEIPMQKTEYGLKNPNTLDGVHAWLATQPEPGSCLIISSQPYIHYQDAVFKTAMSASFAIETVGTAAASTIPISEMLDYVTRHLYQELQRLKALQTRNM